MTLTLSPEKIGPWAFKEVLDHEQVNKIASELVKAVDGVGGGTYTLSVGDLTFTGSAQMILDLAVQLTNGKTFTVDGLISLESDGRLNVKNGSGITLLAGGALNLALGGIISANSGGAPLTLTGGDNSTTLATLEGTLDLLGSVVLRLESGGLISIKSNALLSIESGGLLRLARTQDLAIQSQTCFWRSLMMPQWQDTTVGGDPTWIFSPGTLLQHILTGGSLGPTIIFPLQRLPGEVITAVQVAVEGGAGLGHGSSPPAGSSLPHIQLVKISSIGVQAAVTASVADPSASGAAYDAAHLITLDATSDPSNMPYTMTSDPHYIAVRGEGGSDSVADTLRINSIFGQSTMTAFRSTLEFL